MSVRGALFVSRLGSDPFCPRSGGIGCQRLSAEDHELLFRSVHLPRAVRVGPRAVRELADDAARLGVHAAIVVWSEGLPAEVMKRVRDVLTGGHLPLVAEATVRDGSLDESAAVAALADGKDAGLGMIAVGGGRALDVGKHAAAGQHVPVVTVPTSLSNDGFACPSASLVGPDGRRASLACGGPAGVIVDTTLCARAPARLFAAGVGDVVAKLTAVPDWWLVEHAGEEKVDGVAAAIAMSAVTVLEASLGSPTDHDHLVPPGDEVYEALARALLLGGVAMAVAGVSRPCSGSEHLVSHALDRLRTPPGSHGIQVGLAAYVLSQVQHGAETARIRRVLDATGFWTAVEEERISLSLFAEALRLAPSIKPGYLTVLSRPNAIEAAIEIATQDPVLAGIWA